MSRRSKIVTAMGLIVSACLCATLAIYLYGRGLDDADKISSVLSAFVGLLSLAATVVGVWLAVAALREMRRGMNKPGEGNPRTTVQRVRAGRDAYTAGRDMTFMDRRSDEDND